LNPPTNPKSLSVEFEYTLYIYTHECVCLCVHVLRKMTNLFILLLTYIVKVETRILFYVLNFRNFRSMLHNFDDELKLSDQKECNERSMHLACERQETNTKFFMQLKIHVRYPIEIYNFQLK
jgi:hypothetical protein